MSKVRAGADSTHSLSKKIPKEKMGSRGQEEDGRNFEVRESVSKWKVCWKRGENEHLLSHARGSHYAKLFYTCYFFHSL